MFEFLDFIAEWFNVTIYEFVTNAVAYLFSTLMLLWLKVQLASLEFAWDVAKGVISNLGINSMLQTAWGAIPSEARSTAQFFRLLESLNLLLTAGVTRFVLSFIPGG